MTIRIAIMVGGETEVAFRPILLNYLQQHLAGNMPKLDFVPQDGRIPKAQKLRPLVKLLLRDNNFVIALTDVYTGPNSREFEDAADAKRKMQKWVAREPRFYPHAAQYEFEAWLLPYWSRIQDLSGCRDAAPSVHPETVNHDRPPAPRLPEVFQKGKRRRYSKPVLAPKILQGQDLEESASRCPELRAFLNRILSLSATGQPREHPALFAMDV